VKTIKHDQAAGVLGVHPSHTRKLKHYGLQPLGTDGWWTPAQVLAMAVRLSARRAGANKDAYDAAFRILSLADLGKLREAIADDKRYLRLLGTVCDENLVSAKAAFDGELVAKATHTRLAYVVVDVSFWLRRVDSVLTEEKTKPGRNAMKNEDEKQLLPG
jgi:hypothetical protein